MKHSFTIGLLFLIVLNVGCDRQKKADEPITANEPVFPLGEKITNNNFTGPVWLHMMGASDSTLHARFGNVTFEPKARTNWHSHPGGAGTLHY